MSEFSLIVDGKRYGGWRSVRVTRSIESISGSFEVEAADRWADQDESWPIIEEDPCRVELDGEVVIDGYVDKRRHRLAGTELSLSYSGKDKAAALVECSAVLRSWTFHLTSIETMARNLCAPFGIPVSVQPGLKIPAPKKKQVVNPGDSPFEVLAAAARAVEVLVVSDGRGGIVITRAGTQTVDTPLIQGENVLTAEIDYDATDRFSKYIVASQSGTESFMGDSVDVESAITIFGRATDAGVRRTNRVLLVRTELNVTDSTYAKKRGDWEARTRAAKAEPVTITVRGWRQPNGKLWPINQLVEVHVPRIGIKGTMLISQVDHAIGTEGEKTQLRIVRPDAFTPEPAANVAVGLYKDIITGGKL